MTSSAGEQAGPRRRRAPHIDQTQVGYEVLTALAETDVTSTVESMEETGGAASAPAADVVFAPRLAARRGLGLLLLVALAATAGAAYLAEDRRTTATIGAAVALALASLVLYAVRAGSSPALLSISSGHLEVVRAGRRSVVDLSSPFTRVETRGRPGRRGSPRNLGWRVLVGRADGDPLVIDSSMVDPVAFTAALGGWRRLAGADDGTA